MISPSQAAFVEGKWIVENTVLAHEVVHTMRKHKSKASLMIQKLDLKKAFDRMEWSFLDLVLEAWGISNPFRELIYSWFFFFFW